MTAPRWEDVAASIDRAQRHLDCAPMPCVETQLAILELQTAEQLVGDIRDAALARLADPAQPSAAERWRAVPADVRRIVCRWVERGQAQAHRDNVDAYHALLALAREAEGTPAPAEPAPPTRTPCHRCGKPLARRGVYHVCPHRVPCGSSGWCRVCADRSGT